VIYLAKLEQAVMYCMDSEKDPQVIHKRYCPGHRTVPAINEESQMSKQKFSSVWDAIEDTPQQAASMKARSALMIELQEYIKTSGMTQKQAADLFGVTQPRISDLVRGKIELFSLESLVDMATAAGMKVEVRLKKAA
jgi:predicted XRE-type DNA-binding protein